MESNSIPLTHSLVPSHKIASEAEVQQLLEKLGCTVEQLPVIYLTDPAIAGLSVRPGDVIKVERLSTVTGQITPYYRVVIEGED